MRNNILNYKDKDIVNLVYIDKEVQLSLNTNLCDCEKSKFCNRHHKHITEDLRIIENKKPRELLIKGPNYRETRSKSFSRAYFEIDQAFEA